MKNKAKDYRPKIISFPYSLNSLDIAATKSILWPCHAFSISIPEKKRSALNIFEQTILKLIDVDSGDTEKLVELTCLDKELVAFIKNRLNQFQLINNRSELTKEGKELLYSWNNELNIEYTTATVFVDLHSGKILPFICFSQLSFKKIESIDTKNKRVVFIEGSAGKSVKIRAQQIAPNKDSYWSERPDSHGVIKAIRAFKILHNRYSLLNPNNKNIPPSVPKAEAVSIQDKEVVYLHCKVLVQKGNPDILVTDGLGFGFSTSFRSFLVQKKWEWLIRLKEQGQEEIHGQKENNKTVKKYFKYPEISKRLKNARTTLNKLEEYQTQSSSSQEYEQGNQREKVVKHLYAALEWSLRHIVSDNPVDEWEQIFSSSNYHDNEKILRGFAKKSGLLLTDNNKYILQVKPGAIRHSKVELQPLLALAIAGSNISDSHPFILLSKQYPEFLSFLVEIKKLRDPIEHGSSSKIVLSNKDLNYFLEETNSIIYILLPDIANDLIEDINKSHQKPNRVNEDRYKAQFELDKFFGLSITDRMDNSLKEQLIRAELYAGSLTSSTQMHLIKCLTSAMQLASYEILNKQSMPENSGNIDDLKEKGLKSMVSNGFISNFDEIPKSISTVRVNMLKNVIQGQSSTLGAHCIALFILCLESELTQLKNNMPNFIDLISQLITLRGHGNQALPKGFSSDSLLSIKNDTFTATKILLEI